MVQFKSLPRQPRLILGTRRRARVHSVVSFQSGGSGKFSYSAAGYSLNGLWACSTPQAENATHAAGTNQNANRQRIDDSSSSLQVIMIRETKSSRKASA